MGQESSARGGMVWVHRGIMRLNGSLSPLMVIRDQVGLVVSRVRRRGVSRPSGPTAINQRLLWLGSQRPGGGGDYRGE
jgi:hypothetical protein